MEKRFKPLKKLSLEESRQYISSEDDFSNSFTCYYTITPSTDEYYPASEGWSNVTYYTNRRKPKVKSSGEEFITNEGYVQLGEGPNTVYIMSNPSMPGLFKIGSTRGKVEDRRKQLSSASGVPVPFEIEWVFKLEGNEEHLEKEVHRYLEHKRSNMNREFFDVTLKEAIDAVKTIGKNYRD